MWYVKKTSQYSITLGNPKFLGYTAKRVGNMWNPQHIMRKRPQRDYLRSQEVTEIIVQILPKIRCVLFGQPQGQ